MNDNIKAMNGEVAMLETSFTQNVQKEKNADGVLVDTREELAGLSENQIATAATAAKEAGKEGKFLLPLLNTSGQPVLTNLTNRALRQRIMQASLTRGSHGGEFDNEVLVKPSDRGSPTRCALQELAEPLHVVPARDAEAVFGDAASVIAIPRRQCRLENRLHRRDKGLVGIVEQQHTTAPQQMRQTGLMRRVPELPVRLPAVALQHAAIVHAKDASGLREAALRAQGEEAIGETLRHNDGRGAR
jgi:hypothetical protein